MTRKIISITLLSIGFCTFAQANQDLEVVFDGCQPIEVLSHDGSCGNGPDPANVACRANNGPVRWTPVSSIGEIATKDGSPGSLHNCHAQPNFYQCIVTGNVGDEVSYMVTSTEGCVLDPMIRIR
jgi:hypothetical protein